MDKLMQKHPLQRLQSPSTSISAVVHVLGLASFTYSFWFLSANPNHINQSYGWHFQYLTIIGLALSTLTFTLALLADLTLLPPLFALKNLLSCCSTPLETLISTLYWSLRLIDPALVVPPSLTIPLPADISFHLAPTVFLLLDFLLLSPPYTITPLPSLLLSATIAFAYWSWIELCHSVNGFYPYPLFEVLGTAQRVALFAGSAGVMAGVTGGLRWLYGLVNGTGVEGGD